MLFGSFLGKSNLNKIELKPKGNPETTVTCLSCARQNKKGDHPRMQTTKTRLKLTPCVACQEGFLYPYTKKHYCSNDTSK